jgi:L-alanine-DL-glutamate epimerase-like enolase superfamily enzyme
VKIDSVDAFYLSMPEVLDIGDGSQDMLLMRVRAGGHIGWGECEAAPLVSIASLICPMSHSACKPVLDSVLGQVLDAPSDIARIVALVRDNSADLLQADHTLSGLEIAMWDLLGRKESAPVYELLGYRQVYPKTAYASALFGDTAADTLLKAKELHALGYQAVKFGWGRFGRGSVAEDAEQVRAAREGLGADATLLVDAGTVWGADLAAAALRIDVLNECRVTWLEEPFVSGALRAYRDLAALAGPLALAGGEGSHNHLMAENMIDHAGLRFIQIDAGRIGGIGDSRLVADYADAAGVQYVNHTFTSHLALSASLQAFAGMASHGLSEYPVEARPLARDLTAERILPDADGTILVPAGPGLGVTPRVDTIRRYLVDLEITVAGRCLYRTPDPSG